MISIGDSFSCEKVERKCTNSRKIPFTPEDDKPCEDNFFKLLLIGSQPIIKGLP